MEYYVVKGFLAVSWDGGGGAKVLSVADSKNTFHAIEPYKPTPNYRMTWRTDLDLVYVGRSFFWGDKTKSGSYLVLALLPVTDIGYPHSMIIS